MSRCARLCLFPVLAALAVSRLAAQPMVLDAAFAPRVDSGESVVTAVNYAAGLGGQFLVFGSIGSTDRFYVDNVRPEHALARLLPIGQVDPTFALQLDPAIDEMVQAAITLPDGRLLVSTASVKNGATSSGRVLRLLADGQIDPAFAPSTYSRAPGLALQSDGSVIVWGGLDASRRIARLLADGSIDATFKEPNFPVGTYGPASVVSLLVRPDDSLIITVNRGSSRFFGEVIYRLKRDGDIDSTFVPPGTGEGDRVFAVLPDNRALMSAGYAGQGSLLRRLNVDGSVDPTFVLQIPGADSIDAAIPLSGGRIAVQAELKVTGAWVTAVFILQPNGAMERDCRTLPGAERIQTLHGAVGDGRLIIAQGQLAPALLPNPRAVMEEPRLCLLNPDAGTITPLPTVIESSRPATVTRVALDAGGRILVEGNFKRIAGARRAGYARFNVDRTLDASFVPVAATPLFHLPDGRIIAKRRTLGPADAEGFHPYIDKVVRLSVNGSLDSTFIPTGELNLLDATWLTVAPDGRILVVENAMGLNGTWRLAWLKPDGGLDSVLPTQFSHLDYYTPGDPPRTMVKSAVRLSDGKLLIFAWDRVNGNEATRLPIRLNVDGSTDASYRPATAPVSIPESSIPLPDGRAYVMATRFPNTPRIAFRLNADGSADKFVPPALAEGVPLADGSFLYEKQRYRADGTRDLNFSVPVPANYYDYSIDTAVLVSDGSIWFGGTFNGYRPAVPGPRHTDLSRFVPAKVEGFTVPPASQQAFLGTDVIFQAELGTAAPATFQWTYNGTPIPGATGRALQLASVAASAAGEYRLVATVGAKTYSSAAATLTLRPSDARLVNFSARSPVAPDYPPQIGGFVLRSDAPRRILLRAVGRGVPSGSIAYLPEPVLTLHEDTGVMASDAGHARSPDVVAAGASVGAFPLPASDYSGAPTHDSALLMTLAPGVYTAHTGSRDGQPGISLFEFYDADTGNPVPAVVNVSLRGRAASFEGILIAGFVIQGNGPLRMLIRGIGPGLEPYGVTGVIANPRITLYQGAAPLAGNDDWSDQTNVAEIESVGERVGAFKLPRGSRDAALLVTLPPGAYTVHGQGASGTAGEMMVEFYVVEN